MNDHEKLREAIKYARKHAREERAAWPNLGLKVPDLLDALADAAESTLPKTKMVEVWRVEWAVKFSDGWVAVAGHYATEREAREWARSLEIGSPRCDGCYSCIRVTGPWQQEIPA